MALRVARVGSLVAILIALAGACDGTPLSPGVEIRGSWGGEGFGLKVFSDSASAVFTCGSGTLEMPIELGFAGRFAAEGEYVSQAGPTVRSPARYEGRVSGSAIELTVAVTDTIGLAGTYALGPFAGTRDEEPRVFYCR